MKDITEEFALGRDPLTPKERDAMADYACDICGAALLIVEVGPHFRILHPDEHPSVTKRS